MKVSREVQDLVFLDSESMYRYLLDLEDHIYHLINRYPEYDINTVTYMGEDDTYTIRIVIDKYRIRNKNYE